MVKTHNSKVDPLKIDEYLDAVKAALGCQTDSEVALRLGVQQSRISNYRTGRTLPDIHMSRLIAAVLNLHAGIVVRDVRRARALRRALWPQSSVA